MKSALPKLNGLGVQQCDQNAFPREIDAVPREETVCGCAVRCWQYGSNTGHGEK